MKRRQPRRSGNGETAVDDTRWSLRVDIHERSVCMWNEQKKQDVYVAVCATEETPRQGSCFSSVAMHSFFFAVRRYPRAGERSTLRACAILSFPGSLTLLLFENRREKTLKNAHIGDRNRHAALNGEEIREKTPRDDW